MLPKRSILLAAAVAAAIAAPVLVADAITKPPRAMSFGTSHSSFYRMGASEFTPVNSPGLDDYNDTFYLDPGTQRRYGTVEAAYFIGTPHLPSGARLLAVHVHGCAGVFVPRLYGSIRSCDYSGGACTELAPYDGVEGCGVDTVDLSGSGYVVDNSPFGNQLVIRLSTTATDGSDSFSGVTVEYELQVSPAPAAPTFNDVPTSDFGFQFIEALVASGITGGTGGGNYSPDAYVTRRQMAIFLAKALGLQWR